MAIQLQQTVKGILAEYWKIIDSQIDYKRNVTRSILGLYVNKTHRDTDISGFLDRRMREFQGIYLDRAEQYGEWVKSIKEYKPTEEKDAEGNPIMEEVETNEFLNAKEI